MKKYYAICTVSFQVEAKNENEAYKVAKHKFAELLYPDFIELEEDEESEEE